MRLLATAVAAAALLAGCGGQSGGSATSATGTLSGRVVAGPTCPVERIGSPCPPRAVAGAEVVAKRADGGGLRRTRSAADGSFVLALAPGRYVVTATSPGAYVSTDSAVAVVTAGSTARLTLTLDTGIR